MGLTYEDDILYSVLPMYHSAAHVCLGVTITEGNTAVTRKKFSATKFWEDCVKNNVTVRMSIGTMGLYKGAWFVVDDIISLTFLGRE